MRELTLEELELIAGTTDTTMPVVTITGSGGGGGSGAPSGGGSGMPGGSSSPGSGAPSPGGMPPPPRCETPLPPQDRVDRAVITQHEGGMLTRGYILSPSQFPSSGMTISAGVDMGYHSASELVSSGISQDAINKLTPYIGLTGQTAADYAASHNGPPTISASDAQALYDYIYGVNLTHTAQSFNASSTTGIQFNQIPQAAQTVIMDIGYNTWNMALRTPNFFTAVTSGNWEAAAYELEHWFSNGTSDSRHISLANLLRTAIANGDLPSNSTDGICP